jgi:hypothetical protein
MCKKYCPKKNMFNNWMTSVLFASLHLWHEEINIEFFNPYTFKCM